MLLHHLCGSAVTSVCGLVGLHSECNFSHCSFYTLGLVDKNDYRVKACRREICLFSLKVRSLRNHLLAHPAEGPSVSVHPQFTRPAAVSLQYLSDFSVVFWAIACELCSL